MNDLASKRRNALAAKARLDESVQALKSGLEPEAIADTVADSAKDYLRRASSDVARTARSQPARVVAAGAAAVLFLFRKPIARALFARRNRGDDNG